MKKTGLIWFRNDLRVEDNSSLQDAISENEQVLGLFCFDPRSFLQTQWGFKKTEKYRAQFLIETVIDLKKNLAKLHIPLFVFHEKPEIIFPEFITQFLITNIYLQNEWTAEELFH